MEKYVKCTWEGVGEKGYLITPLNELQILFNLLNRWSHKKFAYHFEFLDNKNNQADAVFMGSAEWSS